LGLKSSPSQEAWMSLKVRLSNHKCMVLLRIAK
jgi:hypothetical protein